MNEERFRTWVICIWLLFLIPATAIMLVFAPSLKEMFQENYINMKVSDNKNNDLLNSISDVCGLYDSSKQKVECVLLIVQTTKIFSYNLTEGFVDAELLIDSGGDCKSWTTFYMATFELMNLSTKSITIENHMYLTVYDDTFYCTVDQLNYDCHEYDHEYLKNLSNQDVEADLNARISTALDSLDK
jgi:hypothetical protein